MPVFTESPTAPPAKTDVVRAFVPSVKTAVVDTRYTPQSDLLAYIEGSTWVVDYYSQILDTNDELGGQDVAAPGPLKQYRRIWSMELKVTQDLSQISVDKQTNETTLQGTANVYPFLVPQVGDMFRAGIADGREGIFKVTNVDPRQIFTDRAHVIEYQLVGANDPVRVYDLDQKTLVTYYYVRDFLLNLQNPLLEEADYYASKKLEGFYYDMAHLYFKQFFSRETLSLVVPEQLNFIYDHGLTNFVKMIMETFDDVHVQSIRQMNIGDDGIITSSSLWDMLERRDPKLMKFIYTKTGLISVESFHRSALMAGMRFTRYSRVVYPLNATQSVDYQMFAQCEKPPVAENIVSKMPPYVPPEPPQEGQVGLMPDIKPLDMEKSYVLSQDFYTRSGSGYSLLEKLLLDYIDFKIIASRDVLKLCDSSYEWGPVEKFYYFPLVLLLIRYNLRRL